jgi:uncharacterized protein with HEPN domain
VTRRRDRAQSTGLDQRTRQTLAEFLEFAEMGARLVERGRVAYDSDEMLRLAGEAIIHRIGEAVARLSDDFTQAHKTVNWRPMKGVRNILAHNYGVIDHARVWNSLETDLPREAAAVRRILDGV